MPKISIVMPVYNIDKYLLECLNSILNQSFKDFELICVDDGSIDNSINILNLYKNIDRRITILQQRNSYAGVARNAGLKIAKGEYITFLDGDDFFELDMLEKMYNKIIEDNSDVVVCSYYNYSDTNKKIINTYRINDIFENNSPFNPKIMINDIFSFCRSNTWTKLFKRDLFIKNNLTFDNSICSNDLACMYSALAASNKISILNIPFIYYRLNRKGSLTEKRKNSFIGFICDLRAFESLRQNLIRLNLYDTFKDPLFLKGKEHFKKFQTTIYKDIAKSILSKELYEALYSIY